MILYWLKNHVQAFMNTFTDKYTNFPCNSLQKLFIIQNLVYNIDTAV